MKNISLILNAVLLVAVAVLFYLHFSGGKSVETTSGDSSSIPSDIRIAYIKSDSVVKHYDYLEVIKTQLEGKTKKMQDEFRNRAMSLQNEIAAYQRNVGSMTLSQVRSTEEDLGKKQQNLQLYEQSLNQQLMEEQAKLTKALYDRITEFLKKYGEEKGLHMVLKYDPSSDVLFGGQALDITQDVITGLNESYKNEKLGVNKDTTAAQK